MVLSTPLVSGVMPATGSLLPATSALLVLEEEAVWLIQRSGPQVLAAPWCANKDVNLALTSMTNVSGVLMHTSCQMTSLALSARATSENTVILQQPSRVQPLEYQNVQLHAIQVACSVKGPLKLSVSIAKQTTISMESERVQFAQMA